MALEIKYEKAADLKIANPEMEWDAIAAQIDVSPRQLRRVRQSSDWSEYWNAADKTVMIETLRRKAVAESNAALFKLYFEITGTLDEGSQEALLKMGDKEFMKEVAYISEWFSKQAPSSEGTDAASA